MNWDFKMTMFNAWFRQAVVFTAVSSMTCSPFAADLTVKVVDKPPPNDVDESIRKLVQSRAVQLLDGDKAVFEFWLCEAALKAKPESPGKALAAVREFSLLGIASVSGGQRDYKDNEVPEGIHTVRFALQPQDGDHSGTADFPYFAVLTRPANDPKPDAFATFTSLMKASGRGTSTGHPVVLSLRPTEEGEAPKLLEPVPDHKSVRVKLPAKTGSGETTSVVFELVYKGKGKV